MKFSKDNVQSRRTPRLSTVRDWGRGVAKVLAEMKDD